MYGNVSKVMDFVNFAALRCAYCLLISCEKHLDYYQFETDFVISVYL